MSMCRTIAAWLTLDMSRHHPFPCSTPAPPQLFVNDPVHDQQRRVWATVALRDDRHDVMFLKTSEKLQPPKPDTAVHVGKQYFLLGGLNRSTNPPFSCRQVAVRPSCSPLGADASVASPLPHLSSHRT